jgi:hypothetical protein
MPQRWDRNGPALVHAGVADDARAAARNGHATWPESFSEMFMQAAGVFANARARRRWATRRRCSRAPSFGYGICVAVRNAPLA